MRLTLQSVFEKSFPPFARPTLRDIAPDSGYIARYASFIWHKSPANGDAHLTESIFQTRSKRRRAHICMERETWVIFHRR